MAYYNTHTHIKLQQYRKVAWLEAFDYIDNGYIMSSQTEINAYNFYLRLHHPCNGNIILVKCTVDGVVVRKNHHVVKSFT